MNIDLHYNALTKPWNKNCVKNKKISLLMLIALRVYLVLGLSIGSEKGQTVETTKPLRLMF